jgi:hypothetical protein
MGGSYVIPMTGTIYVGLAATSHTNGTDLTAVIDNLSVSGTRFEGDLEWDGTDANWGDATRWLPDRDTVPGPGHFATVPTGVVHVASSQSVYRLSVAGDGEAHIDPTQSLDVAELAAAAGTFLKMGQDATLNVGVSGDIHTLYANAAGSAGGITTLNTVGDVTVTVFDDQYIDHTLVKGGAGTLTMLNQAPGEVAAEKTSWVVKEGELALGGSDPLGLWGGSGNVELGGGQVSLSYSGLVAPVAHYTFDDAGNLENDDSGNGNHLTNGGNVTADAGGKFNGAASFDDSSGGYFDIPNTILRSRDRRQWGGRRERIARQLAGQRRRPNLHGRRHRYQRANRCRCGRRHVAPFGLHLAERGQH